MIKYLTTFLVLIPIVAYAHGYWYDHDCCSNRDCFPVNYDEVYQDKDEKWHYKHYVFQIARPSKDANFHVCIQYKDTSKELARCIYTVQSF